jgi:hypothetical protein
MSKERWNLITEMVRTPWTFRDFEGLAGSGNVIGAVQDLSMDLNDFQKDVLLNLLYEYVDEGTGELPDEDTLYVLANVVKELTTTREWSRTGIVWK